MLKGKFDLWLNPPRKMIVRMVHFVMQNIMVVGFMGTLLVIAPLIGIMIVHEQGK